MAQSPTKTITLAEFLQIPETKPSQEYIDGKIIPKPMSQGKHSTIQGELVPSINTVVKPKRIARAFPELRCTFGDRSTVPDGEEVIEMYLEAWQVKGESIPEPSTLQIALF